MLITGKARNQQKSPAFRLYETPRKNEYNESTMRDANQTVEQYFLEMRWRCLSLAADLDRIERCEGGASVLKTDARLQKLRKAFGVLLEGNGNRAEQVQMIFSDMTPPPTK
jgi:hypothetical protein